MGPSAKPTIFLNRLPNGERQVLYALPLSPPIKTMGFGKVGGSFDTDFLDQGDFGLGVQECVVKFMKLLFENTLQGSISNIDDGDSRRDALYKSLRSIKNLSYRCKHTVNEKLAQRMPQRFIHQNDMGTS